MRFPLSLVFVLALAGCASKSSEVAPTYVSSIMYQNYTRQQIAMEAQNVSSHAAEMAGA
jgi:hypothetical protein